MRFKEGDKVVIDNIDHYSGNPGTNSDMEKIFRSKTIMTITKVVNSCYRVKENGWSWGEPWLRHTSLYEED